MEQASTEKEIRSSIRISKHDSRSTSFIKTLAQQEVFITKNTDHKTREAVSRGHDSELRLIIDDSPVPFRDTLDLWGSTFTPPAGSWSTVCTDGSTFCNSGKNSGAAFVFTDDEFRPNELWPKGIYCKIARADNYMAEMQAINMALRSVPVTVSMEIFTDSLSSIQAINKLLRQPDAKSTLRNPARPYLLAVRSAIREREKHGGLTKLTHVYSHTGGRDKASIGNAGADRLAKWAAWEANEDDGGRTERILRERDLGFLVNLLKIRTTEKDTTLECTEISEKL
jgi:ribonuclease HI